MDKLDSLLCVERASPFIYLSIDHVPSYMLCPMVYYIYIPSDLKKFSDINVSCGAKASLHVIDNYLNQISRIKK